MIWHPTKDAVQRLWGRRWIRRVTYAVVAGAALYTGGPWLATRPVVVRWALGHLDRLVQEETGLPLTIGRVELRPSRSALVLHEVRLGETCSRSSAWKSRLTSSPCWALRTASMPCAWSTPTCA